MKYKRWMELGRSMVEMLGVLAIIGVLSIVGIAGYKKAMAKIHANELMELGIKIYNESVAKEAVNPSATDDLARLYLRGVSGVGVSTTQHLGWEAPSWTAANFNIMARARESSHVIIFYYLTESTGGKEVCEELATMTQESNEAHYRLLPSGSIKVACNKGNKTDNANSWW